MLSIRSVVNWHATHSTARCDAVVTVRTYSDDSQCLASGDARPIAGLSELGIMDEPTVAAIASRVDKEGGGRTQRVDLRQFSWSSKMAFPR